MKAIGFIIEPFEFITVDLIQKLEDSRKEYQVIVIGIHSDEYFYDQYGRAPIKSHKERMQLANSLKAVDFVFLLDSNTDINSELISIRGKEETSITLDKPYNVAYAPGTYDLFHEGHLSHLTEVKSLCKNLIVGVNSDKLVYENKKKFTKMSEKERIAIVKNLSFVDYVFLVESNQKSLANKWSEENLGLPIDVIFLGSDLKGQNMYNDTQIPILFTERDPILMERRSSTFYRKVLEELQK